MDLKKRDNENELQYIWRLGFAKDNGEIDMSWDELANVINQNCRNDETEYRTSAAYRKPYQYTRQYWEAGVFNQLSEDAYIEQLRAEKFELREIKQQLFDERTALNKKLRESARTKEDVAKLEELIKKSGKSAFPKFTPEITNSGTDLIIALSDFHLGITADTYFGSYNSDIARERLMQYASKIIKLKEIYNAENAYLILLGDLISGEIHFTTQLENRENVTEQVQKAGEYISAFAYEISKHFNSLYINGIAGNHSRTSYKDCVLRGNRLDNLIPWYMKAKLSHIDNIEFIDGYNYDPTIGVCEIRGKSYLMVHGDYDKFTDAGVAKLVMMLGYKPEAVFCGHLHKCSYDESADVRLIRSGSFCGTVDDYTISKRLAGKPTQMVCAVNSEGVIGLHPTKLD